MEFGKLQGLLDAQCDFGDVDDGEKKGRRKKSGML